MLFQKSCEWMIVGLGNPGTAYEKSRHNTGFRTVDLLAKAQGVKIDRLKCKALTRMTDLDGHKVLLVKPQTYMNLSGQAVLWASQFYKVPTARIIVIFDDVSLPVGRIRVRGEGSAGGHNGIKSIIAELGTQGFPRIKIGVGEKPHPDYDLADWVLSGFTKDEQALLTPAMERAVQAARAVITDGLTAAESKFNGK